VQSLSHILVTGGAGFIGGNFVLGWLSDPAADGVINVDKLTYAGHRMTLASVEKGSRHFLLQADICDRVLLDRVFAEHRPRAVLHFAAESHVDRSIQGPAAFIQTNLVGTFTLLEAARAYWRGLGTAEQAAFRFLHISTDEVFGSLGAEDPGFSEATPYRPNSPYSASKAGADHLVRAYHHTYGLPVHDELFQWLWAPSVSREIDSPDHHQRIGRQTAADLRGWSQHSRLVVRWRSLCRVASRSCRWARGRNL